MIKHGKLFEVISDTREGSRVRVRVQVSEKVDVTKGNLRVRTWLPIDIIENTGGFKHAKDFNYSIAKKLALHNCADKFQALV